ncbi:AbrB/MazE/SpoVT family DNA-binding domain-containing protein [Candidatus Saccharibacteria bacterium]|nr:AbrB/MazE/SpoVT family DNA-binding domain-containing protein [Candidatus Saccharibacteria bacterium]
MNRFKGIKIFGIGKVGPKGQVVIPSEARKELGFKPGDKVVVAGMPHNKSIMIMSEDTLHIHLTHMRESYEEFGKHLNSLGGKGKH